MKIIVIADIVGDIGREAARTGLARVKSEEEIDLVIANGENAAGGFGITSRLAQDLFRDGIDVITMGNHVWDRKEILDIIEEENILRPANYPPGVPGRGALIFTTKKQIKVGIINLVGRVFMNPLDDPFRTADKIIEELKKETNYIIVDFHAEATSEKQALGWYLDGRVSAVIGTHTHVPTADEQILPNGTAYITDIGMTGALDSVIGIKKEVILQRFLLQMPVRFEVANKNVVFTGVVLEIEEKTGKANSIKRFQIKI